jgi:translation initiation factor 2-alpha kinase 4
MRDDESSEAS